MSRSRTSFVLGYHGCERHVGLKIVRREQPLQPRNTKFDWIGQGIYFWEGDPIRAYEWAKKKKARNHLKDPFVIGAVIDLGNCLDLLVRENVEIVKSAFESFKKVQKKAGLPLPKNRSAPKDNSPDLVMRYLDCAVIDHLHSIIEGPDRREGLEPYDSVRAVFEEGEPIFEGSKLIDKNHAQIAVRNLKYIKGYFLPLGVQGLPTVTSSV